MKRKRSQPCSVSRKKLKGDPSCPSRQPPSLIQPSALNLHYNTVCTLGDKLLNWLPSKSRLRRKRLERFDTDFPQYSGFLQKILVGSSQTPPLGVQNARQTELLAFSQTQRIARGESHERRTCDIGEIVDYAIWTLFRKDVGATRPPAHLLCYGFQKPGPYANDHVQYMPIPEISQRVRNPNVESLKQPPWTNIADIMGKDAEIVMLHLLLDCGIFQQLDTGKHNLYQISGEPFSRLQHPQTTQTVQATKPKRPSTELNASPAGIVFVRNRMFYARPSLNRQGKVQLGLRHIHILNRCSDLTEPKQDIRILQYIFPRQFGLHNVFTSKPNSSETNQPLRDYTMREQELASVQQAHAFKVPRRLRGPVLNMIRLLRRNHRRCSYTQLLLHYCPIVTTTNTKPLASSLMTSSIASEQLLTQIPNQTASLSSYRPGEPRSDTSFLAHAAPAFQVSTFCQAVLLQLLPRNAFGTGKNGDHNWRTLLKSVNQFVEIRRFESMTLHEVSQRIKMRCIAWLRPVSMAECDNVSATDGAKRLEILHELIYYIFDSILIPLIRSNFYVTETGVHRYRLFYFRHDVWKKMADPSLAIMRLSMFEPLNALQVKQNFITNSLGYSQMRLLPKEHGVRAIMNLKRRAVKVVNGKSILGPSVNKQLAPVFSVLNLERQKQFEIFASALFSVGEIQNKLRDLKARLDPSCHQKIYFAKVDIRSCFDTIPQKELIRTINKILLRHEYQVTHHAEVRSLVTANKRPSIRTKAAYVSRAVLVDDDCILSSNTASLLANTKKRHIFVGLDQSRIMKLAHVQKMLADHIQHNIVRVGRKHFSQVEGIPQGSILSSLLCNLFYGDFERQELKFLDPKTSLLLRLIDDFLLITTDQAQAKAFVHAMSRGHTKYGISVSTEKSLVNFELSIDGHKLPRMHGTGWFPYCGMGIHTEDLRLRKERQRKDLHVENALTVHRSGEVGAILQNKVTASLTRQLHAMLLDGYLNTRAQVLCNVFECFMESGMKMHQYLRNLPRFRRPTAALLIRICAQLIDLGFKMVHRPQLQSPVLLSRLQISWLAATALTRVLARKQSEYGELLVWLSTVQEKARRSMTMTTWELERMVKNCSKLFVDHVY